MKYQMFLPLLMALTICCQNKKTAEEDLASITFEAARSKFFMEIQAPADVAARLQAAGAEFIPELLNDPLYFSSYTSNEVKAAANLGIYLSDLNYSVAYQQSATTRELFQAIDELSKVVGIEQRILSFLKVRYEQNINQNDSVRAVFDELLKNATVGLQGTDREKFVGIVIAGYQIENLHLALGIIQAVPTDLDPQDERTQALAGIKKLVLEQQQSIETTYQFLRSISDPTNPDKNPNLAYYATAFEELIAVYSEMKVPQPMMEVQAQEILTDVRVQSLHEKISAIRIRAIGL